MNSPKVSIIVPVYNVEKYIERCAVSLFEQTYSNIEYVFVNDCSIDQSIDVLNQIVGRYYDRANHSIIINHQVNRGVAAARNTALDRCTGEFVCQIDPDDYIELDAVESLLCQQEQSGSDIVTGQMVMHRSDCDVLLAFPRYLSKTDMVIDMMQPTIMHSLANRLIRRSLFENFKIRAKEGVNCGEDCWMMTRLAYFAKSCNTIDKVVYHYDRTRENSYTSSKNGIINKNKIKDDISTANLIIDFFKDKETVYYDEANRMYIRYLYNILQKAARAGESELFEEMKSRIVLFDKKYLAAIHWNKRYRQLMTRNIYTSRLLMTIFDLYSSILSRIN